MMTKKYKIEYAELTKKDVDGIIKAIFDGGKAVIQDSETDTAAVGFINLFESRLFWNCDRHVYIQPHNPKRMAEVLKTVDERKEVSHPDGYGVARSVSENTITLTYIKYVCCTD